METPTHVGSCIPAGHVMVHVRWKGSGLLRILQSKLSVMFFDDSEFGSTVDFKPSTSAAVIYIRENDILSTAESRRRVAKFRRTKGVTHHRVLIEKTKMTQQYFLEFQKFVVIECNMSIFPVLNQEEAGSLIAHMVQQDNKTPYRNPFRSRINTTTSTDVAILNTVKQFQGIGDTKAKQLLEKFGSIKAITEASVQDLSSVIGLSSAKKLKLFLEG